MRSKLNYLYKLKLILNVLLILGGLQFAFAQNASPVTQQNVYDFLLIDVRTAEEHKIDGLKFSVNIPYQDISKYIKKATKGDKSMPLKLYGLSGRRASIAQKTLQQLGYTNVVNIGSLINAIKFIETHQGK